MFYKYPSIEQFNKIVQNTKKAMRFHNLEEVVLKFMGTTKLHGTNGSIGIVYEKGEPVYQVQSRNNILTLESDNAGFAQFALNPKVKSFVKEKIEKIYNKLSQEEKVKVLSIFVYGEWAGSNIQKGVAITQMEKFFAPFDVAIYLEKENQEENSQEVFVRKWLDQKEVEEFKNEELRIFPISTVVKPEYLNIKFDAISLEKVAKELSNLTIEVEKEDPFAKHFGFSGVGEGIVWKVVYEEDYGDQFDLRKIGDLRFKVKGEKHAVSKVKTLAPIDFEKVAKLTEAVDKYVTENRLNQGIDYLNEMHKELIVENTGFFIQWIQKDILKEEQEEILISGLEWKKLSGLIAKKSAEWFKQKILEETLK